jgi:hypothetical protein
MTIAWEFMTIAWEIGDREAGTDRSPSTLVGWTGARLPTWWSEVSLERSTVAGSLTMSLGLSRAKREP